MDINYIHNLFLKCSSVSIDTRKIGLNSFFVAIKGDNFDANTFAKEALDKGASYVLIDNEDYFIDERTILVENCLVALQELVKVSQKLFETAYNCSYWKQWKNNYKGINKRCSF